MANENILITDASQLDSVTQKILQSNAEALGLKTAQEYLDSRGGVWSGTNYYGDTPEWAMIPFEDKKNIVWNDGQASWNAARKKQMISVWSQDFNKIPDPDLRRAVQAGKVNVEQAAQAYVDGKFWSDRTNSFESENAIRKGLGLAPSFNSSSGSTPISGATGQGSTSGVNDSGSTVGSTSGLTKDQGNAVANLTKVFESYGLGSLAPSILDFVKQGYAADTVSLLLQETPQYKQRFAANEARRKAGMAVLSPAEYLATEKAYRQIMNAAGLPKGFYDQQEDFTDLLSKDISPAELNARVANAADAVINSDPYYTQALRDMYGMTNGDMIAFVLSPDRSLPLIQQKANAVSFGAAANRQGITGIDNQTAELFGGQGVGKQQAETGFAQIATTLPTAEKLGDIYGMDYTQTDALNETFGNDQKAAQKRRRLVQSEVDTFSGQSGVRGGTLSQATQGLI